MMTGSFIQMFAVGFKGIVCPKIPNLLSSIKRERRNLRQKGNKSIGKVAMHYIPVLITFLCLKLTEIEVIVHC